MGYHERKSFIILEQVLRETKALMKTDEIHRIHKNCQQMAENAS